MKRLSFACLVVAALTGCAATAPAVPYPADPVQQARYHLDQARQEFAKGEPDNALLDVAHALKRPGGAEQLKALVASDPAVRMQLIGAVNMRIDAIGSVDAAKQCDALLARLADAGVFEPADPGAFQARYAAAVRKGNESGRIAVLLGPDAKALAPLADSRQMRIVFDRTMSAYRDKSFASGRDMAAVVAYLQSGSDPSALAAFRNQLPSIDVRRDELDQVARVAPEFVRQRRARMSMNVRLVVKNADRRFTDDVVTQLSRSIRGVTWTQAQDPGVMEVTVMRIRDVGKFLPTRFTSVIYTFQQVDPRYAAPFMSTGSMYQYELTSSGAELEYGYVITAWKNGARLTENVLQGTLGGLHNKCENARIVGMPAGIRAAHFLANDEMKRTCSGEGEGDITLDKLRAQLLGKISSAVTDLPGIAEVNSLNL